MYTISDNRGKSSIQLHPHDNYSWNLNADAVAKVAICFPSQSVYRCNVVCKNTACVGRNEEKDEACQF
jgi:hypothetical protein